MKTPRSRPFVLVALLAIAAFLVAFAATRGGGPSHLPAVAPRPTPAAALGALTAAPAAPPAAATALAPKPALVAKQVASAAAAPGFGGRVLARIVDASTGTILYDRHGSTPAAPASTAKLLTAAAVLTVDAPSTRFATTVVDGGSGTVVLVGGGDPTLSGAAGHAAPLYAGAARLADLAAAVTKAHLVVQRIVVDGALFPGPTASPNWDSSDVGTSYGSGITALMTDGGRATPNAFSRSVNPDLAAGARFATLLGHPGLPVTRGTAPAAAKVLGRVESAPLSALITEMLQTSDNTIADVLARQVAVAEHVRASFHGATTAIRTVLARDGVQVGSGMKDGSGLSSDDRVSPAALVGVLRLVVGAGPPASAQVHFIAGALPVGGWSGTLADRFDSGSGGKLAGEIRAKTGTLSTVSSLAGFVHDKSGRLLVFSFDADQVIGTINANAALDHLAVALAKCGCS